MSTEVNNETGVAIDAAEFAALADHVVAIPMWGAAESLNLSSAAAICLYQTASAQRR